MSLKPIYQFLEHIKNNPSRIYKEQVIDKILKSEYGSLFKNVVIYALDPFRRYNITNVNYYYHNNNPSIIQYQTIDNIFKMLDYLSNKSGATIEDKNTLSNISSIDEETVDVVNRIVNKDLLCGANIRTFIKFIKELHIHEIMLGLKFNEYDKFMKTINNDFSKTVWSHKLDGVRNWAVINSPDGMIQHVSRNGLLWENFNIFDNELRIIDNKLNKLYKFPYPHIFDGEVVDKTHTYQNVMTQVKRIKDLDPSIFKFCIFDLVIDNVKFLDRYKILDDILNDGYKYDKIELIQNHGPIYKNKEDLLSLAKQIKDHYGDEGIMIKTTNHYYEYKRSNHWLKVKPSVTLDVRVTGWEFGKNKYSDVIGNFNCVLNNGVTFDVGTGLSDEQRFLFMGNVPKIIEVKFDDYTRDGKPRFPQFIRVRDDKNETD